MLLWKTDVYFQRMSVLVSKLPVDQTHDKWMFVKGAPETIKKLSCPETVPKDFSEVLSSLTQRGYRVLAMGYKKLRINMHKADKLRRCSGGMCFFFWFSFSLSRDEVECELDFCGLIVFENRLKPETTPVLETLNLAAIRTVMVTG